MENQQPNPHQDEDSEGFRDDFQCCVCLDLFYKPVVLACGHIACFWCVFKSMDNWQESHCMICRHPYSHFPRVCTLLHFLLLKLYPLAYERRELLVSEEEKQLGHVSPQFDDHLSKIRVTKAIDDRDTISPHSIATASTSGSPYEGESSSNAVLSKAIVHEDCKPNLRISSQTTSEVATNENGVPKGADKHLLRSDLLCSLCKQLLCRPVVLNCGDVFCEPCINSPGDKVQRCPVCHRAHPNGFPNVCLVLEHFLEEQFPEEYAVRKQYLIKQIDGQSLSQSTCSTENQEAGAQCSSRPKNYYSSWFSGQGPKVHVNVGCDYCGMCPIVGERYRCKDCVEKIGFDLCEQCYHSSTKLPGRFNQQHTEDHEFELVQPLHLSDLILRLDAESYEDDSSNDLQDMITMEEVPQDPISSSDAMPDIEDALNNTPENEESTDSRTG